ncbi:hypothetical protein AV944_00370 [Sphingomonas sp. LK11]|uniref:right-handed parallel beta-helix repeat-containing protein n=1 Tax=Sphingomonas sp. LK11 TaxID=1390395 RepID=UPI000972D289|nr:right-handed parallel beta-helix repeat-containing protein [Sphingomonas sp. LK11]APX64554.1 hypothetical protein AV944_00370 [Sphingomonas sp. LK11]
MAAYTGGGKGAIVCLTESCLIEGNVVRGNNFCIGFNAMTKAVVRWNLCYDSSLKDYSWGIGIGTEFDSANVEIYGNVIRNCNRGITLSGTTTSTVTVPGRVPRLQSRSKITVRDNIVEHCGTGFFIDRPTSGLIENNTMRSVTTGFDVRTTSGPQGEPLVTIINNTAA